MPETTKKMLDQLLDEAGKDILLSGAMVVDRTTGKSFSDHLADTSVHKTESDINGLIDTALEALKTGDFKTLSDTVNALQTTVNNFLTGEPDDNGTLDRLKELVAAIEANKDSIDALVADHATKAELTALVERVSAIEPKAHEHANKEILDGVGKATNGNLTFNGRELNGETGIAIVDSAEATPTYTGKIRMVVTEYTPAVQA